MANRKTRSAHKQGFCSQADMLRANGNQIFKGSCCDTAWDAKASKHTSRKVYKKKGEQ